MQPVLTNGDPPLPVGSGGAIMSGSHFSALLSLVREAHITEVKTVLLENQRLRTILEDLEVCLDDVGRDESFTGGDKAAPMLSSKSRREDVNRRWQEMYGSANKSATFDNGNLEKVLTKAEEAYGRGKPKKVHVRPATGRPSSSSEMADENDAEQRDGGSPQTLEIDNPDELASPDSANSRRHVVPAWLGEQNKEPGERRASYLRNKRANLSFMRGSDEAKTETQQKRSPCPYVYTVVSSPYFDTFFAVMILCNSAAIAVEAQLRGLEVGHDLGYNRTSRPSFEGKELFDFLGFLFGLVFTIEIVLRMCGFGRRFWKEFWNLFDTGIVIFWVLETLLHNTRSLPDPSLLQVLRLMKLLRLVRLFRQLQGFGALYLMTTALWGSFTILAGSAALLILMLMMLALLANQVLVETYLTQDYSIHEKVEVYEYFGTFSRALLSLFEMTLANWPPVCRLLVENVSELYLIPALVHKLTIGFAVVGIINGVFMQETLKVAATDDRIMVRQKAMAISTHIHKMEALFAKADKTGDGWLDIEEFKEVMSDKGISTWLASMDLDTTDVETLFALIDSDGGGRISSEELIMGVSQLKGPARSVDLAVAMRDQQQFQALLSEMAVGLQGVKSSLASLVQAMQAQAERERSFSPKRTTATITSTMRSALTRARRPAIETESPQASAHSVTSPRPLDVAVGEAEERVQAALSPRQKSVRHKLLHDLEAPDHPTPNGADGRVALAGTPGSGFTSLTRQDSTPLDAPGFGESCVMLNI